MLKRLNEIRDSDTSKADREPRQRKRIISSENFEKTKLASNDRVKRLTTTITNELTSAGLGDDPIRVLFAWIIIAIVLPMIENLMGLNLTIIFGTILVSTIGPVLFLQLKKNKRMEKFEKQLPHAIDIICNALKAGYTFQYSMNNVAKELDNPISEEFLMAFRETQYGATLSDALQNMARRTSSKDIELLDIAVSVQTNVGGNMIEILENISSTLTAKHDLEEDIKVKTASGKITGIMLAVLPILLLVVLNFMNPDYISIFFEEAIGQYMLIFCALWELIGFLIIRKILSVKF
jgi:tight adherence protein B